MSLNVGGGVHLIKPAKLYMCTQTNFKHDEDGRTAPDVRGHGSLPLRHSSNVVTRIGLHTHTPCHSVTPAMHYLTERRWWRRFIKPAKLYMCTQTHYKHDEDGRRCARPWFRTTEALEERRNENWIIHTHTLHVILSLAPDS